ncbi:MAG TPA: hypothetical protein PL072_04800 [Phycisphaerales bacterium]|nr:hypothetical protein [Phycisphaerales bacterium]
MSTKDPETMTPMERDAEVASILARGLMRAVHIARSRSTRDMEPPAESSDGGLELPPHAGLSVAAQPAG